jgi:hypothetical protein
MDQEDQTAGRMQSSIMETPPSESQTPGRVTSALGASTQQDAHPLPEQINHMDLDRTADSSIASRFGTMLINTIPEERTLGASSIQGASDGGAALGLCHGESGALVARGQSRRIDCVCRLGTAAILIFTCTLLISCSCATSQSNSATALVASTTTCTC